MTKVRPPISTAQAMERVMGVVPIADLAALADRSERTVYEWSDPDSATGPSHEQAILFDLAFAKAGGEGAPFQEHHAAKLQIGLSDRRRRWRDLFEAARSLQKEAGDVNAAMLETLDHDADEHDLETAARELMQLSSAVSAALATLRAPPESPPPSDTG